MENEVTFEIHALIIDLAAFAISSIQTRTLWYVCSSASKRKTGFDDTAVYTPCPSLVKQPKELSPGLQVQRTAELIE